MSIRKKRLFIITTFLLVAAVVVVLLINYFTSGQINEFDGTLVNANVFRCI